MEMILTQGKVALVDETDWHLVAPHKWCASNTAGEKWYAQRWDGIRNKNVFMHRVILAAQPGQMVDHRDGNGLNNCRDNIRIVTACQNQQNRLGLSKNNSSGFRGVYFDKQSNGWRAKLEIKHKRHYLGLFPTREAAAEAYSEAAKRLRD